jgi:hypothetical protein
MQHRRTRHLTAGLAMLALVGGIVCIAAAAAAAAVEEPPLR